MKKYRFESSFVDVAELILDIRCVSDAASYRLMINAWEDPYTVYYSNGDRPNDVKAFEQELFAYLREKYAERGLYA